MKTIITFLFLVFGVAVQSSFAQEKTKVSDKKKQIEIRPNSRDYGPVIRDNLHNRVDRKNDKAFLKKKKTEIKQRRAIQIQRKQIRRQQQINKRREVIQQRRTTRR